MGLKIKSFSIEKCVRVSDLEKFIIPNTNGHIDDNIAEFPIVKAIELSQLNNLRDAWIIEGRNPEYHKQQQEHLRIYWPTLYRAIIKLIDETTEHEQICEHCNTPIRIRNLSGHCDHLKYPEYCEICSNRIKQAITHHLC